jgi:hypothetical protein
MSLFPSKQGSSKCQEGKASTEKTPLTLTPAAIGNIASSKISVFYLQN